MNLGVDTKNITILKKLKFLHVPLLFFWLRSSCRSAWMLQSQTFPELDYATQLTKLNCCKSCCKISIIMKWMRKKKKKTRKSSHKQLNAQKKTMKHHKLNTSLEGWPVLWNLINSTNSFYLVKQQPSSSKILPHIKHLNSGHKFITVTFEIRNYSWKCRFLPCKAQTKEEEKTKEINTQQNET